MRVFSVTGYPIKSAECSFNSCTKKSNFISCPSCDVFFTGSKPASLYSAITQEEADEIIAPLKQVYSKFALQLNSNPNITKDEITSFLKNDCSNSECDFLGIGTNSMCYKVKNYAVRFFRPDAKNYGNDSTYEKEAIALKKVKAAGVCDSQELIDVIKDENKHYIVTNIINGETLNPYQGRILNKAQMEDATKKLTLLEKSGFIQYDAQIENILYDKNKAKFIDFGGFSSAIGDMDTYSQLKEANVLMDYGESFYPSFPPLSTDDIKRFNLSDKLINAKPYLGFSDINTYYITSNSNPYFSIFSNSANFEYRSLYYHLLDTADALGEVKTSKNILTDYLNQRAKNYHTPMAEFIEGLDIDEVADACMQDKEVIAKRIKDASSYERNLSSILSADNIPDDTLKTELAKMQIRWCAQNKPKACQTQFEDLTSMIMGFRNNNGGTLKKYYDDSLEFFEKIKSYIYSISEGEARETLDDSCNLVKRLFNETINTKTSKPVSTPINTVNKNISKSKAAIAAIAIFGAIGAIYTFIKHKRKVNVERQTMTSACNTTAGGAGVKGGLMKPDCNTTAGGANAIVNCKVNIAPPKQNSAQTVNASNPFSTFNLNSMNDFMNKTKQ